MVSLIKSGRNKGLYKFKNGAIARKKRNGQYIIVKGPVNGPTRRRRKSKRRSPRRRSPRRRSPKRRKSKRRKSRRKKSRRKQRGGSKKENTIYSLERSDPYKNKIKEIQESIMVGRGREVNLETAVKLLREYYREKYSI